MKKFDYRGLKCPIPVLKAYKEVKKNPKEKTFIFECDDPSAPKDFKDLCKNTGLILNQIEEREKNFIIIITKN